MGRTTSMPTICAWHCVAKGLISGPMNAMPRMTHFIRYSFSAESPSVNAPVLRDNEDGVQPRRRAPVPASEHELFPYGNSKLRRASSI